MARTATTAEYVATETFFCDERGSEPVVAGVTRVRTGSKLLELYPQWFRRAADVPEAERATAAPGEARD